MSIFDVVLLNMIIFFILFCSFFNFLISILSKTIRIENLAFIYEGLNTNLSEFFADKRFKDAEAHEWQKKKKENNL